MKIKIVCNRNHSRKSQIVRAVNTLNSIQAYYSFTLDDSACTDVTNYSYVNWQLFLESYVEKHLNEYIIYITEKPFDDNWFSHDGPRCSIITTGDWEHLFAPPSLKAYLMYQIVQSVICFVMDITEDVQLSFVHSEAVGCMFDFCKHKPDIKLGLTAGAICPKCRASLKGFGVQEEAITSAEQILDCIRMETIGRPMEIIPNSAFIIMRFSDHDENDNAYRYGIRPALAELGIECRRGDDAVITTHIMEKVRREIERCRYIIVKVDEDNLNVYFELGLAMGFNKDIVLLSEQHHEIHLPADLRGWNCLTYKKGHYDDLKDKVVEHYRSHYSLLRP